jgi:hypothetical protein
MAASMMMAVFWVVALCSLVEDYQRFRGTCCLHHQIALMMEAAITSEMLINTTQCYNPEDSHLNTNNNGKIKSVTEFGGSAMGWLLMQEKHFSLMYPGK